MCNRNIRVDKFFAQEDPVLRTALLADMEEGHMDFVSFVRHAHRSEAEQVAQHAAVTVAHFATPTRGRWN
jgi:hypothetical protein